MALKLEGDNRIKADQMWRSARDRDDFENETGLKDSFSAEYHGQFIEWALRRIEANLP